MVIFSLQFRSCRF